MPPLTPSRMRAMARLAARLAAVAVLDLARRQLLERDRQVVAGRGVDHRRGVFLVGALTQGAVVAVELAGPLSGHENRGVVGIGLLQQLVDAWSDHRSEDSR